MISALRDRLERYPLWSICYQEYKRRLKTEEYKDGKYPISYEAYLKVRMKELKREQEEAVGEDIH